jgi:outer membrane protein TolC
MRSHVVPPLWAVVITLLSTYPATAASSTELALADAERFALAHAPLLSRFQSGVDAAAERVIYEGRLPDPQIILGALNVPSDSFRLNEEDMTMVMAGLRQQFPPGNTLGIRTQRARSELSREQARYESQRRNLLRQVRATWLDLYYLTESQRVLGELRNLAQNQLRAAEGRYRASAGAQQAVLQARQGLARLDDRMQGLRSQAARAQATLARWIGESANLPLPSNLPTLPTVPEVFDVAGHPEWLDADAEHASARLEVELARQEYKPGMMLDLSYGARQQRADLVTVMVTFDLPVFRAKRQDRRLAEKQSLEAATRYETEDRRRELDAMYRAARAEHDALMRRVELFSRQILPDAQRETQVTVAGFARDQTEYREARMKELETYLELVRLRVDLTKAQAELLYLTGEESS